MHKALKKAAEQNHRSLNGEILIRLENSLGGSEVDVDALLARVKVRKKRFGLPDLSETELRELKKSGRP